MIAVIESGAKQYLISQKDKIKVEKLPTEEGREVVFDKVLLLSDGKSTKVGKPYVKGAKVTGKVLKQGRTQKMRWIKYKSKTRYRRHRSHRQDYTEVEITKIA